MLAFAGFAFASETAGEMLKAYSVVAAGIGLGLAALGGAIGMGNTAAATIAGTARNPRFRWKINDYYVHCFSDDRSSSYLCISYCDDCIIC